MGSLFANLVPAIAVRPVSLEQVATVTLTAADVLAVMQVDVGYAADWLECHAEDVARVMREYASDAIARVVDAQISDTKTTSNDNAIQRRQGFRLVAGGRG